MITQYPDTIVILWTSEPVPTFVLDEEGQPTIVPTGDYIAGASQSHTFQCRAEVNTRSRLINGADGSLIDYVFDVYMPLIDVVIPDFEADYVLNGTQTGKVKRARNGQLNSRLWV